MRLCPYCLKWCKLSGTRWENYCPANGQSFWCLRFGVVRSVFIAQNARMTSAATWALQICFYSVYYSHPVKKLTVSFPSRLDSLPRNDGGGCLAGWPCWQTGKEAMPHHITCNQCCLCVPLLLRPGIRILPLLPPYLRPRVGTWWIWAGAAPAQLGSVAVWGGTRKGAQEMHPWCPARMALPFRTCGCVTSLLTLRAVMVRKFGHWCSSGTAQIVQKCGWDWKMPISKASTETLKSSHWLPVFCLPKMSDYEITRGGI